MENMFCVTSASGKVKEYFDNRESAIDFIVDEFAMAVLFRYDDEGKNLAEYLRTHDETPNQYPYKYMISEINVNHDYDKPKSIYMVYVDYVTDCTDSNEHYFFHNYEDAREKFDELVDEDVQKYGEIKSAQSELNSNHYGRWDDNEPYCAYHFAVDLVELEDKDGKIEIKN